MAIGQALEATPGMDFVPSAKARKRRRCARKEVLPLCQEGQPNDLHIFSGIARGPLDGEFSGRPESGSSIAVAGGAGSEHSRWRQHLLPFMFHKKNPNSE